MKRTIAFLAALSLVSCSKPKEIDYAKLKKIEGVLCEKGTITAFTGIARDYHADGKVRMEIPIKNGKFHGTVKEWHANGKPSSETAFVNGERTGLNREWTEDGKPFNERVYDHDHIVSEKKFQP